MKVNKKYFKPTELTFFQKENILTIRFASFSCNKEASEQEMENF
ncbi:hypothetical protein DB41_KJ00070 [Neochlamydia sp. TUME1]|nr:hypothetical protein DB41_KJ00070 [Neochlamydia sp. TUME1]